MTENSKSLKIFRLVIFPIYSLIEIALILVVLLFQFYSTETMNVVPGYRTLIAWILFTLGFFTLAGLIFQFLTAFSYRNQKLDAVISNVRTTRIIGFITILLIFCQIVTLSITQLYYTIFSSDVTPLYLLIICLSILPPALFYFIANFETDSEKIYALSKEAPLRLKLTAIWLVFLTAVMQIFATSWEFLIVGLLLLIGTYLFYNLYKNAVVITPSILIIHFVFSAAMAIASFILQEEIINDLITTGEAITPLQATLLTIFVFVIPGLISILLAQSFFRKWVLSWIRDTNPEPELEIKLEMAD